MAAPQIWTSSETKELHEHAAIATDAGGDGAPVDVISLAIPVGWRATCKCKLAGKNAANAIIVDAEWSLENLYYPPAGVLTEGSAAVLPVPNPALLGVTFTYTVAAGAVTLKKQNASGTALTFSGEIVAALAKL